MMSGLTPGLMSLSLVDLEILAKYGTPHDSKYAVKILSVVKKTTFVALYTTYMQYCFNGGTSHFP